MFAYYLGGFFCIGVGVIFLLFAEPIAEYQNSWRVRSDPKPSKFAIINNRIGGCVGIVVGLVMIAYAIFGSFLEEAPPTPPRELGKGEISHGTVVINPYREPGEGDPLYDTTAINP